MDRVFFSFLEFFLVAFPLRRDCKTKFSSSAEEEKQVWRSASRRTKHITATRICLQQGQQLIGHLYQGGGVINRVPSCPNRKQTVFLFQEELT